MKPGFKPIPWDNQYLVDIGGRVYSSKSGRFLRVQKTTHGYAYIGLKRDGLRKNILMHRLLLELFGPEMPHGKEHVNHLDGDKLNNHISNLEWCTRSENAAHSIRVLGNPKPPSVKGRRGRLSKLSKPIIGVSILTGETVVYESMRLADSDGFRIANVRASISGKVNHYKGFKWQLS